MESKRAQHEREKDSNRQNKTKLNAINRKGEQEQSR